MGTYQYSGHAEFITVNQTTTVLLQAYGAQGGNAPGSAGGKGAEATGVFTLQKGEELEIVVGGAGGYGKYGGGGGGGTFILQVNSNGTTTPLLVAGGGGGGYYYYRGGGGGSGVTSTGSGSGGSTKLNGAGGGAGVKSNGNTQYNGAYSPPPRSSAQGGFNISGNYAGGAGSGGGPNGGFGGGGGNDGYVGFPSGGGGGGYTGGNGGYNKGGAGGSSFDAGTPISEETQAGVQSGNGLLSISSNIETPGADVDANLYDTLGGTVKNVYKIGAEAGFSFTTDGTGTFVSYQYGLYNPGGGSGTFTAELFTNKSGNIPGTEIASLGTVNDSQLASSQVTMIGGSGNSIKLAANTTYWLVGVNSPGNNIGIASVQPSSGVGYANEYEFDSATSETQSDSNGSLGSSPDGQIVESVENAVACFAAGTAIRTTRGDVAIETLQTGDLAITASGQARPIRWVGRRSFDCAAHRDPAMVRPIRVQAGAFGGGRPTRDLLLSPHHAVAVSCVGEVLVPIRLLTNGTTIAQLFDVAEITYWHVELDSHDVILANGLPAESYIDVGNRCDFEGEASLTLHPEFRSQALAGYCRPFVTGGAVLAAIRAQLAEVAGHQAARPAAEPGFYLLVDSERIAPTVRDHHAAFVVPAGVRDVRIVSPSFAPHDLDPANRDDRRLGLMIQSIAIDDLLGTVTDVALDDPSLVAGFHPLEGGPGGAWRWTDGDALLSALCFGLRTTPWILRLTGQFAASPRTGAGVRLAA